MNFEVRYSIDLILTKIVRAKRIHHSSFDIRHSTFQCSFTRALPLAKRPAGQAVSEKTPFPARLKFFSPAIL
ncbi:hypothetical protein D1AOALGA4SA_3246 [Olavius algarvensis Delta 1 endosymbiont]|nr:hypothetical protein D1AOALGA4SA_3246 [Olavius algarvensis Delta 1 endosymbiont]